MAVKLLTVHHLEFQSLKGGCIGSSESTLVQMPHCWKSHAVAQIKYATALRMISDKYLPVLLLVPVPLCTL